jgi:hypothetical protein
MNCLKCGGEIKTNLWYLPDPSTSICCVLIGVSRKECQRCDFAWIIDNDIPVFQYWLSQISSGICDIPIGTLLIISSKEI